MKKKKLLPNANLPSDLWHEILPRLPVKSLVRFLCISKSWHSLISDPDFCRLHLERFKNNRDETHLLVVQGTQQNFVLRRSDSLKSVQALEIDEDSWKVSSSIDGLVLLKSCNRELQSEFRLWNPSIRKLHKIPPLPDYGFFKESEIGLGYDPLIKDYKHFRLRFLNEKTLNSVAIYTLGADSWKIIPLQGEGFSKWHWNRRENMMSVYSQGSLHFLATDFRTFVMKMVSVDLTSEVFSCISLPSVGSGLSGPLTLVDDGSTLALFDFWRNTNLWVLENTSWTLRYTISLSVPRFLYHRKNGDLVISEDEGNEKSVSIATVEESQARKYLVQRKCLGLKIYDVYGYVESLIMLR